MDERRLTGQWGEEVAVRHLETLGWRILDRNWRFSRVGELDIVALDPSPGRRTLVFCEVKTKLGDGFGAPLEAITIAKLRRLHRLSCAWMACHDLRYDRVRIDAIGIRAVPGGQCQVTHAEGVRL